MSALAVSIGSVCGAVLAVACSRAAKGVWEAFPPVEFSTGLLGSVAVLVACVSSCIAPAYLASFRYPAELARILKR